MNDPTYIIKHMGRLVHDEKGIGRFAGSTTGVHFVLTVEQECQTSLAMPGQFPASCFRLFLAQPSLLQINPPSMTSSTILKNIRDYFSSPSAYYVHRIEMFIRNWDAFCPILVRDQLIADTNRRLNLNKQDNAGDMDYSNVLILLMIIAILKSSADTAKCDQVPPYELMLANQILDKVMMQRDIRSLQALVLFALYNQLNSHCLAMTTLNGYLVSLAQSLGLHRHARRFKIPAGEVELRKRLWWWVYSFDRVASVFHGLPTLIDDADVDNDMPMDCYLHGSEAPELSHPLPGERTAVFFFIQYVSLCRKLSRILDALYTTTRRRDGATKIADLDLELRMWNQNLKTDGIYFDIGSISGLPSAESQHGVDNIRTWLQLMANYAMVLIHRPGLSFDDTTSDFAKCLRICLDSSQAILTILSHSPIPFWLRGISLMGPGTVFQSALMYAYCQGKFLSSRPEQIPSLETSMTMISKGIFILESDLHLHPSAGTEFYHESISEVIATLQTLRSSLAQVAKAAADATNIMQGHGDSNIFQDEMWVSNALDDLNYMSATDWMGEMSGPFMGFMGMGGS
ncbi:hypothetical protein N7492_000663 [Penicillium capsulatum]|uniref:Xylanolytic transcriptional activator regulatory domain-containing protein n=1 Tax=Penicillium capsulatum TaxID=69766 RepID=A0A9W9IS67_9EURO|nr:hypothetical protein N7492_000663 [Penicillium capsulatum]KAJ6130278.1 hypothetical protein N7512_003058 [Penicillium capsulatum]